jgi:hypothetical protein
MVQKAACSYGTYCESLDDDDDDDDDDVKPVNSQMKSHNRSLRSLNKRSSICFCESLNQAS